MNVETYKNERGEIAVLVSRGYGAGWSTWNPYPELAWDKRVVELFLRLTLCERYDLAHDSPKMDWARYLMSGWGYSDIYWGGFNNCSIEWVPAGKPFRIDGYDGAEDLEFLNMEDWAVLN